MVSDSGRGLPKKTPHIQNLQKDYGNVKATPYITKRPAALSSLETIADTETIQNTEVADHSSYMPR